MQTGRSDPSLHENELAIVLVTTSFPVAGDGSEAAGSFVLDLATELARHGPCRVVAPGPTTSLEEFGSNLWVYRFEAPEQPLSTLRPWSPRDLIQIIKVMRSGRAATLAAVDAGPTGMILALWAFPSGHWARQVAMINKLPYLVWTLGSDIWSLGRIPLLRGVIKKVLRDASTVFSDGIGLAEDTTALCGRQVEFLPSTRSINTAYAGQPRGHPPYRLTYIGRWHPNKGIDLLMSALERLSESNWARIESVSVYGGGPLEREVNVVARRLSGAGRPVILGGYLNKREAERVLSETDWLLIPSRIESIPLIYSDALKLAVPVLATPVGDLEYLVREDASGELAKATTAEAIAILIGDALSRAPAHYRDALAKAAKRFDLSGIGGHLTNCGESDRGR